MKKNKIFFVFLLAFLFFGCIERNEVISTQSDSVKANDSSNIQGQGNQVYQQVQQPVYFEKYDFNSHLENISNYESPNPQCKGEKILIENDVYLCNATYDSMVYINKSNSSDFFRAWGMTQTVKFSYYISTDMRNEIRYNVYINENTTSPSGTWSDSQVYANVLKHELCHVGFRQKHIPYDYINEETECNNEAGW